MMVRLLAVKRHRMNRRFLACSEIIPFKPYVWMRCFPLLAGDAASTVMSVVNGGIFGTAL